MLKEKDCPKCGRVGLEPKWHSMCKNGVKKKDYVAVSNEEHLHYICPCGYDFISKALET